MLFLAILACCAARGPAQAALLSQRSFGINRSSNIFTTSTFKLEVEFGDSLFFPNPIDVLFDDLTITPASAGQTFTATLATDARFNGAATRLTDAHNQAVRFVMTETASSRAEKRGYAENQVLNQPLLTPDFAGKKITSIQLHINSFHLDFGPPAGAQAAVAAMPVDLQFTFSVFGVPEPASAAMGLGALAMLAGRGYSGRRNRGA
jgi:hypothetical protein